MLVPGPPRVVDWGMRVASLYRYPVKSMLGERVASAVLSDRGVLGDRGYGLVDIEDGKVASAKLPRKWSALLTMTARYTVEPRAGEALPPVVVTLADGTQLRSDDAATDAALSDVLGRQVRLTSTAPPGSRFEEQWPQIAGLAPEDFITSTTTSYEGEEPVSAIDLGMLAPPGTFFDLAPLHVLATSTLEQLARLAPDSRFDVSRYRPNVLVEGAGEGFVEDGWTGRVLALGGDVRAPVSMPAMRCVMTTLPQGGAAASGLPEDRDTLRTIARSHRVEIAGLGTWACAGSYAGVTTGGTVREGDEVSVS